MVGVEDSKPTTPTAQELARVAGSLPVLTPGNITAPSSGVNNSGSPPVPPASPVLAPSQPEQKTVVRYQFNPGLKGGSGNLVAIYSDNTTSIPITKEQQQKNEAIAQAKKEGTYQTPGGVESTPLKALQEARDKLGINYISGGGGAREGGPTARDLYVGTILSEYEKGYIAGPAKDRGNPPEQRLEDLLGKVQLAYNPQTKTITDPLMAQLKEIGFLSTTEGGHPGGYAGISGSGLASLGGLGLFTTSSVSPRGDTTKAYGGLAQFLPNPTVTTQKNGQTVTGSLDVLTKGTVKPKAQEIENNYNNIIPNTSPESQAKVSISKAQSVFGKDLTSFGQKDLLTQGGNNILVKFGNDVIAISPEQYLTQYNAIQTNPEYGGNVNFLVSNIGTENSIGPTSALYPKGTKNTPPVEHADLSSLSNVQTTNVGGHNILSDLIFIPTKEAVESARQSRIDQYKIALGNFLLEKYNYEKQSQNNQLIEQYNQNIEVSNALTKLSVKNQNTIGVGIFANLSGTAKQANKLVEPAKQYYIKGVLPGIDIPIPVDITTFTKNIEETAKAGVLGLGAALYSAVKSGAREPNPLKGVIGGVASVFATGATGTLKIVEKLLPFTGAVIEPVYGILPAWTKTSPPLEPEAASILQSNTSPTATSAFMGGEGMEGYGYFTNPIAARAGSVSGDVVLNLELGRLIGRATNEVSYYGVKVGAEVGVPEPVLRLGASALNPIAAAQEKGLLPKYEEYAQPLLKSEAVSPAFPPTIENTWLYKGITLGKYGLVGFVKLGTKEELEKPVFEIGGNIKYGIGKSGLTRHNVSRGETSVLTTGTPTTSLSQNIIATGGEGTPLSEGSQFGSNIFLKNILAGSYKLEQPTTYEQILTANEAALSSSSGIPIEGLPQTANILNIPVSESDLVFNNQLFGVNEMKVGESEYGLGRNYVTKYPNAPFNMSEMQVDRILTLAEIAKTGKGVKPEVVRELTGQIFKNLKEGPQTEAALRVISKYQKPFAFGKAGIKSGDYSIGITRGSTSQMNQVLEEYNRLAGDIEHKPLNSKVLQYKFLQELTTELNKVSEPNELFTNTYEPYFQVGQKRTLLEKVLQRNKEGLRIAFKGKPEVKKYTGGVLLYPELSESSVLSETTNRGHPYYLGGKKEDIFQFAGGKNENGKYISTSGFVWGERTPWGGYVKAKYGKTQIKVSVLRLQELRKNAATSSLMAERLAAGSRNITVEEFNKISNISGTKQGIFPIPHRAKDVGDTFGTSMSNAEKLTRQGRKNQGILKAAYTEHMRDVFPTYDFESMFAKKPGSLEYWMKGIKPDLTEYRNIGQSEQQLKYGIFRPSKRVYNRNERVEADYGFEPKVSEYALQFTQKPNRPLLTLTYQTRSKENKVSEMKQTKNKTSPKSIIPSIKSTRPPTIRPSKPSEYNIPNVKPSKTRTGTNEYKTPSPQQPKTRPLIPTSPPTYNTPLPPEPTPLIPPTPPSIPPTPPSRSPYMEIITTSIFSPPTGPPKQPPITIDLKTKTIEGIPVPPGDRANFLGNTSESQIEGIYNRQEIIYGMKRTAKLASLDYRKVNAHRGKLISIMNVKELSKSPKPIENIKKEKSSKMKTGKKLSSIKSIGLEKMNKSI